MRTVVVLLFLIVVFVAAAVFVVPAMLPQDLIREQVASTVARETGRTLTINGDVKLAVFPTATLQATDVTFSNAPGGKAENMASMASLDVGLALIPLLGRRVEIQNFVLTEPVIHLEIDKNGKPNWEFESQSEAETPADPAGDDTASGAPSVSDISFGDVRIVRGQVSYAYLGAGTEYSLSDVNAGLALPSLDKPFNLEGDAVFNGEAMALDASVAAPRVLLEGGETDLDLSLKGSPLTFAFKGSATIADEMALAGRTTLDVPSVKGLAAWAGSPIEGAEDGPGFGRASLKGDMSATGSTFSFANAELRFDEIEATGNLKATLGKVPLITANLSTPMLDLRPYVAETDGGSGGAAPGGSGAWSTQPMDVSALKSFNALVDFEAGGLKIQDMTIGRSDLSIRVRNGVMKADLTELALYQGLAKGTISLDATRSRPALTSKLSIAGVALAPFLKDAAHTDRFEGTGTFDLNLAGAGRSQAEIIASLGGNASIKFLDGAIKGVDLNQIAAIVNAFTGDDEKSDEETEEATAEAKGSGEKTEFVELGGTFDIAKGIVRTGDLKLINELISVSGRGTINLPKQTLDLRLHPGQSQSDGGLKVALRVTGPWSDPKFTPDASALIKNELEKRLGDSPAADILNQLLGGESEAPKDGQEGEDKKPDPANQLIDSLFGR